ncbi:MAG: acyl carrier protein [Bacteroidota bacterium]
MNTQQRIINMISWMANVPPSQICMTTNLRDDLGLDSIDVMSLIVQLEKWFDIILTNEEVEQIETVKDASDCISRHSISA